MTTTEPVSDNLPALPEPDGVELTAPLGLPTMSEWGALERMAQVLSQSGLVPSALRRKPDDIILILLTGRDLRIQPTVALQKIHIIEGKATASAELMTALVNRQPGMRLWPDPANDARKAVAHAVRDGQEMSSTFTIEDAQRAGLAGKGNWAKWPQFMLWARAASGLCRQAFSDVLCGVTYTPEELGAEVDPETGAVLAERAAPPPDASPFLSPANVDAVHQKATNFGLHIGDLARAVYNATGGRTDEVAEVLKTEVAALRDAMSEAVAAKTAPDDTPSEPLDAAEAHAHYVESMSDDAPPSLAMFAELAPKVAALVAKYADDKKAPAPQRTRLILTLKRVCGSEDDDQRLVLSALLAQQVTSRALLTAGQVHAVLEVLNEEASGT